MCVLNQSIRITSLKRILERIYNPTKPPDPYTKEVLVLGSISRPIFLLLSNVDRKCDKTPADFVTNISTEKIVQFLLPSVDLISNTKHRSHPTPNHPTNYCASK
jgi:hypothetical protein